MVDAGQEHKHHKDNKDLDQAWSNYGPGAGCDPFGVLIQPVKLV